MPRLVSSSLVVAVGEVAAGTILGEPALLGAAILSVAFGAIMVSVGYLLELGRERWVGPLLAISVYVLGLLGAILVPGAAPASAMLPILSVVLILPGRDRGAITAILAVALAGSALALLLGDLPHPFPPLREPLGSEFASVLLLGVALLILGALTDFAIQATESLDRMHRVMQSQVAGFAERTAIVASIGKIERKDTIEATAGAIVEALMRLPDVDLAAVFACTETDIEVLAMTGPPGFPARPGELIDPTAPGTCLPAWPTARGPNDGPTTPRSRTMGRRSTRPGSRARRMRRSSRAAR